MNDQSSTHPAPQGPARPMPFPIIRHFSRPLTPWLARTPVTANQLTAFSALLGILAAVAVSQGTFRWNIAGAILLFACYVLDNCDGEIARLKNQCSHFGMRFDSFADWLTHTAFFIGLGFGVDAVENENMWIWVGFAAAAGCTVNYAIGFLESDSGGGEEASRPPAKATEWMIFAFRELSRADFCFIVLALALLDALWVLLPGAAVGAQIYWALQLLPSRRRYHV